MCNSVHNFLFVDQLLLVDVFSQLYYPTYAKKQQSRADFRYRQVICDVTAGAWGKKF